MAKRIRRAHRRLVHAGRAITPDTPAAEVHELRKDAKKLRYLLECFGGLYAPAAARTLRGPPEGAAGPPRHTPGRRRRRDRLRDEAASARAAGWPAPSLLAIGQLIERHDRRRQAMRLEVGERFDDFDSAPTRRALDDLLDSERPAP